MVGSPVPKHYSHIRWGDQLDTGNVLIKRKVFEKVGLFDLRFEGMRMGDHEFGARSHQNGFTIINNHRASREHLKTSMGGFRERIDGMHFDQKAFLVQDRYQVFSTYIENTGVTTLQFIP